MTYDEAAGILSFNEAVPARDSLKRAYRKLMLQWHPDRFRTPAEIAHATVMAQRINAAYELLSEYLDEPWRRRLGGPEVGMGAEWFRQRQGNPRHTYRRRPFTPGFPDETVFEVFVRSSHIVSAGYSAGRRVLYIKFDGNAVYEYSDVPADVFEAFLRAPSHGQFANRNIYHAYRYRRCEEPNRPYRDGTSVPPQDRNCLGA